jgi:hypothetical protein
MDLACTDWKGPTVRFLGVTSWSLSTDVILKLNYIDLQFDKFIKIKGNKYLKLVIYSLFYTLLFLMLERLCMCIVS